MNDRQHSGAGSTANARYSRFFGRKPENLTVPWARLVACDGARVQPSTRGAEGA